MESGYGADASRKGDVYTYECDIASPSSVQSAFSSIAADIRSSESNTPTAFPSILVNAAGYVSLSKMEETPPEETTKHLNANVLGPMLCSQAFARLYFAASTTSAVAKPSLGSSDFGPACPGRVVSISSQAAHRALNLHGAYCASKAGLMGLTRSMAREWGGRGITANTVSPTVAWTDLGKKAWGDKVVREAFQKLIPTGRFAMPGDVAEAVAFLCRDESGMINGDDIKVDGGFVSQGN